MDPDAIYTTIEEVKREGLGSASQVEVKRDGLGSASQVEVKREGLSSASQVEVKREGLGSASQVEVKRDGLGSASQVEVKREGLGSASQVNYYTCKAVVARVRKENIMYMGCPMENCKKKVEEGLCTGLYRLVMSFREALKTNSYKCFGGISLNNILTWFVFN